MSWCGNVIVNEPDRGVCVIRLVRVVSPRSRMVALSGLDESGATAAALSSGAARYVIKGDDIGHLLSAVPETRRKMPSMVSPSFPADPKSAGAARAFARVACERWRCDAIADSVLLVTSELVTNAITHARSRCELTVRLAPDVLRIEVFDDNDRIPSPLDVDGDAEHGRGLFLVAALARSWGIDPVENGKVVWAELSRTP